MKTFFHDVYISCVSLKSYKRFISESYGKSVAYLARLAGLVALVTTLLLGIGLWLLIDQGIAVLDTELPAFEMTNNHGVLTTDLPQPFYFKNFLVVDTSGAVTSLENTPHYILITAKKIIFKKSEIETREFVFQDIDYAKLTKGSLMEFVERYRLLAQVGLVVVLFLVLGIGLFGGLFAYAGVLALIGWLFVRSKRTYAETHQVALHAVTAPLIITQIWNTLDNVPQFSFTIIFLIYFIGALQLAHSAHGRRRS